MDWVVSRSVRGVDVIYPQKNKNKEPIPTPPPHTLTGKSAMERFWKTVRMPNAVPERREDSVSCTARGTEGQMTAAMMLCLEWFW